MTFGLRCSSTSKVFIHLLSDRDAGSCSTQLIDGDGGFNVTGLEQFMKEVKLGECGLSYAVVSIMGPQSSGMYFFPSKSANLMDWQEEAVSSCCVTEYDCSSLQANFFVNEFDIVCWHGFFLVELDFYQL